MHREGLIAAVLLAAVCIRPVTSQELPFHRVAMHYQSIEDLEGTGFDAVYLVVWWGGLTWDQGKSSIEEVLRLRSVELSTRGVKTVVGLFYCMPSNPDVGNYSRAVGSDRLPEAVVPSPVDETWWNYYVDRPAVLIANLSLQYPIWGIVWDWERYVVYRNFETWDYSYDEAAIQEFALQTNRTIPCIPPLERHSWLESHGLLEEFHRWQEKKLFRMAKETESKVHAINPNLSLGLLAFSDDWFPWNVLTAFNSSGAPVTAWVATYAGYNVVRPTPAKIRDWLKDHKLDAFFLPGIWVPYGPWRTLTEMEAATRDSGAFWAFLWDREKLNIRSRTTRGCTGSSTHSSSSTPPLQAPFQASTCTLGFRPSRTWGRTALCPSFLIPTLTSFQRISPYSASLSLAT